MNCLAFWNADLLSMSIEYCTSRDTVPCPPMVKICAAGTRFHPLAGMAGIAPHNSIETLRVLTRNVHRGFCIVASGSKFPTPACHISLQHHPFISLNCGTAPPERLSNYIFFISNDLKFVSCNTICPQFTVNGVLRFAKPTFPVSVTCQRCEDGVEDIDSPAALSPREAAISCLRGS